MSNKKSILVLDDEASVCESIAIILSQYAVHFETSTEACLEHMSANPLPDLLIVDYKVGPDNGVEFYTTVLSKKFGKIPAILISGYVGQKEQPDEDSRLSSIFIRLVQKPFDIFMFKALIEDVILEISQG